MARRTVSALTMARRQFLETYFRKPLDLLKERKSAIDKAAIISSPGSEHFGQWARVVSSS
jgi:hypothetical protein